MPVFGGTITVDAQWNIFVANPETPLLENTLIGNGLGVYPVSIDLASMNAVRFNSVTGEWGCCQSPDPQIVNGPDGRDHDPGTDVVNPTTNLSGILYQGRIMFLVGVFLGDTLPAVQPGRLDFTTNNQFGTFAVPALGQVFFIGDGRGAGGAVQAFLTPENATKLYLGLADAADFQGDPCCYTDNSGALNVEYELYVVPEPGTFLLAGGALAALALRRAVRSR
jgi:hypothetical protein